MSAVPKPDDVIPIRPIDPDEPRMPKEEELFQPPFWGKFNHSEDELQVIWSLIWKNYRCASMCQQFLHMNKSFPINWWREALGECWRWNPEIKSIHYVIGAARKFHRDGLPSERMAKKLAASEASATKFSESELGDDETSKAIERRNKEVPPEYFENHPTTLRFKNRNRGAK